MLLMQTGGWDVTRLCIKKQARQLFKRVAVPLCLTYAVVEWAGAEEL